MEALIAALWLDAGKEYNTVKSAGINSFKSIREMVANQNKPDNKLNEQTKFPALPSTKKPLVSSHTNPTKQSMSYAQAALKNHQHRKS